VPEPKLKTPGERVVYYGVLAGTGVAVTQEPLLLQVLGPTAVGGWALAWAGVVVLNVVKMRLRLRAAGRLALLLRSSRHSDAANALGRHTAAAKITGDIAALDEAIAEARETYGESR
jgi:hypothetical protein